MPVSPTYPGVYIEEKPSGVRTIIGTATSITAFVGSAARGPSNTPVHVFNFGDFERAFGGLDVNRGLGYMVQQYFVNGGSEAIIVRVVNAETAKPSTCNAGGLSLVASSPGSWGDSLIAKIDSNTNPDSTDPTLFNLTVEEKVNGQVANREKFLNLSVNADSPRFLVSVLGQQSDLVNVSGSPPTRKPSDGEFRFAARSGKDGNLPNAVDYEGSESDKTGIYALKDEPIFNMLCLAPFKRGESIADTQAGIGLLGKAATFCKEEKLAMLLVDPPTSWDKPADPVTGIAALKSIGTTNFRNTAIFFPAALYPDPLRENRLVTCPPSGAMAGIFARTDANRGVWKAPAGLNDGGITGAQRLSVKLTLDEIGRLNPLGINCLRTDPVAGNIVWGSRTMDGDDVLASEWKYIPVRRTALFLEQSLLRGTQWAVFEPNDEPLWSQLRTSIGAFMQTQYRKGAFQGQTPDAAYFVKVDSETTRQADIDAGIVNILVGFAPLKPAEFVIIQLQQIAGQTQS